MSFSVSVPWDCTCCLPACTLTDGEFVKSLTQEEYLQLYYASQAQIEGDYTYNTRRDYPSGIYEIWTAPTVTASAEMDTAAGCTKSANKVQVGGENSGTFTTYYTDGSTSAFNFTPACQVIGSIYLNKSGSSLSLRGHLVSSPDTGSTLMGARFPATSSGGSTGGTIDFSIDGTSVTGVSFGEFLGGTDAYQTVTSSNSASCHLTVTLGTPP